MAAPNRIGKWRQRIKKSLDYREKTAKRGRSEQLRQLTLKESMCLGVLERESVAVGQKDDKDSGHQRTEFLERQHRISLSVHFICFFIVYIF